jgi:hypothetical protein
MPGLNLLASGTSLTPVVATQYEVPFKLSISTFHVSVMAITPAIASHKVRHPSPSNFSVFMACD